MHILLFEIIVMLVFIVLLLLFNDILSLTGGQCLCCLIIIVICSLTIPNQIFNNYATYDDEIIASYELVKNDYLMVQSGENSDITISYIDNNNKLQQKRATGCIIHYYDGIPKIEFIRKELSFLYKNEQIVYLNKE